jgi:hypothetical protein
VVHGNSSDSEQGFATPASVPPAQRKSPSVGCQGNGSSVLVTRRARAIVIGVGAEANKETPAGVFGADVRKIYPSVGTKASAGGRSVVDLKRIWQCESSRHAIGASKKKAVKAGQHVSKQGATSNAEHKPGDCQNDSGGR